MTTFQYLTASSMSSPAFLPVESTSSPAKNPKSVARSASKTSAATAEPTAAAAATATATPVAPPETPTSLVSQIMDMGFEKQTIEYAIQCLGGASSPEPVVMWLLEHPDAHPPSDGGNSGAMGGGATATSPDSEDSDYDPIYVTDESEEEEAVPVKYKLRTDFPADDDYARYVRDTVRVNMTVRCRESYEEVRDGDYGRVTKVKLLD